MMGHKGMTPLDRSYFKTATLDLAAGYVAVVPDLTVDDADRLRSVGREKDVEIARLKAEIAEMRRRYIPA